MNKFKKLMIFMLIFLLFGFVDVYAENEIEISNISVVETSRTGVLASFVVEDNNISVTTTSFQYDTDYVKYQFHVINHSDQAYTLAFNNQEDGVLSYDYDYDATLSPEEDEVVTVTVAYAHPLTEAELIGYDTSSPLQYATTLTATGADNITSATTDNPKTYTPIYLLVSLAVLLLIATLLLNRKYAKYVSLFLIAFLAYRLFEPVVSYAVEDNVLEINFHYNIYVQGASYRFNYYNQYLGNLTVNRDCTGKMSDGRTVQEVYDECIRYDCTVYFVDYKGTHTVITDKNVFMQSTQKGFYECGSSVCLSGEMLVEVYDEKKKRKIKKKLKDVTEDDLLLVWNFDEGCYEYVPAIFIKELEEKNEHLLLDFDDGSFLDVVGEHRIFNVDCNRFTDASDDADTPIGTKVMKSDGTITTLVKKTVLDDSVISCCVITEKHFNLFVNDVLTSVTLNNMYPIENMKYVKNNVEAFSLEELNVDPYYYEQLRISELSKNFKGTEEDTKTFIHRYIDRMDAQNTLKK